MLFGFIIITKSLAIFMVDWHKEGNLLACCSSGKNLQFYDKREGKIVRTIKNIHSGWIDC